MVSAVRGLVLTISAQQQQVRNPISQWNLHGFRSDAVYLAVFCLLTVTVITSPAVCAVG
jgi:hypothetical protein